jgi:hypothetical protein
MQGSAKYSEILISPPILQHNLVLLIYLDLNLRTDYVYDIVALHNIVHFYTYF